MQYFMKRIRRVTTLTGLIAFSTLSATSPVHAAEAPFRAGVTPPYGDIQLSLDAVAAGGNFTAHIEKSSIFWSGRTVDFWILVTLQPDLSLVELGAWRQMRIDCDARTRMVGSEFPLDKAGNLLQEDTYAHRPVEPVNPNTMDEFLLQILCEGRSFDLDPAVTTDILSAAAQGQAVLQERFP